MPDTIAKPKLGFIGLGLMGSAMAEMLLAAGYELTSGTESEPLAGFAAEGRLAANPAEVAAASEIVLLCVLDTDAVRQVALGPDGVADASTPPRILVDHSTAMPVETASMAAELQARTGMAWVDCPVSGGSRLRAAAAAHYHGRRAGAGL